MNKDLQRYPIIKNDPLRPWDSADELILDEVSKYDPRRILIIGDAFGALAANLPDKNISVYTDSFVSAKATQLNTDGKINCLSDLNALEGIYDLVLIKIPKNMSYFEDILCHLSAHLIRDSKLICGSMVKHLAPASFDLLQKYIGLTTTSLAQKKARLIFANFEKAESKSPYPLEVKLDGFEKPFLNHSNLFSREKLDIGSRFFLEHIPKGLTGKFLDLGCANGVIGIKARQLNPGSEIIFCDESWLAIQSARKNYSQYFSDDAQFVWTNCYEEGSPQSLDLVLCNPPFHQQNTIGDFIAWQMFNDAHRALKKGGMLRIIGNSHLGYQHKLKKIFGNSKIVATNQKFMIVDALK